MTRVLSSACAVLLLLLGLGGSAWAGGKPPIAILGLEVYDNGSGIDPETTKAAKELTTALRDRAKAGTGPYAPVPGGDKELIDEKLLNNCDSEAPTCMAAIGASIGAEVLMYGKIEKAGSPGQVLYKVSIKLLSVNRKQLVSSTVETLPVAESTGVRAQAHAKGWYAKLTGASAGGTVVITANIDRGTVLLDDEVKGNLSSGSLTLPGVSEGRHTLAIEAKDHQRYETSITVRNGETVPHSATLVEMSRKTGTPSGPPISVEGTVTSKPKTNVWKPIFYGTTAVAAGAAGFAYWQWTKSEDAAKGVKIPNLSDADCGGRDSMGAPYENDPAFKDACSYYKKRTIGFIVAGAAGALAVGSFIMAYVVDRDAPETKAIAGGHKKRRELAVTPILTPDGGGATLQFDW